MYVLLIQLFVCVIAYFVAVCVHVWNRKPQDKHPN
jgi:hypothetical protein